MTNSSGNWQDLGRRVEAFYGDARDIEWAIADGQGLASASPADHDRRGRRHRAARSPRNDRAIEKLVEPSGTVWSRTNLIEILPEPTPLTWDLVSGRLLSATGGTGDMYRDFGFQPDPTLLGQSAYDLIGGRPYLNLGREPRLESAKPLSGYPLAKYKSAPRLALDPKRDEPRGLRKWLKLFGLLKIAAKIGSASKSFSDEFRKSLPGFAAGLDGASREDLTRLEVPALFDRFHEWERHADRLRAAKPQTDAVGSVLVASAGTANRKNARR